MERGEERKPRHWLNSRGESSRMIPGLGGGERGWEERCNGEEEYRSALARWTGWYCTDKWSVWPQLRETGKKQETHYERNTENTINVFISS